MNRDMNAFNTEQAKSNEWKNRIEQTDKNE